MPTRRQIPVTGWQPSPDSVTETNSVKPQQTGAGSEKQGASSWWTRVIPAESRGNPRGAQCSNPSVKANKPPRVQRAAVMQVGRWHMGQLVQNNPGQRRDYLNSYIERNGCWIYTGSINNKGYGTILGRAAHRYFYEHMVGIIPEGLTIDHLCRVTACVNPMHLEPVTAEENLARGAQMPGHCRRGHPVPGKDYRVLERGNPAYDCERCNEIDAKQAAAVDDPNEPISRLARLVQTNLIRRDAGLSIYNWQTLPDE